MNPVPLDVEHIIEDLVKECKEQQRMINIFVNVNKKSSSFENEHKLCENLDSICKFRDQYTTSNSHLFFF